MPVVVMGNERGHDTVTRIKHNFGAARPEGYRKAVRLMDMADQFGLPVISFVDTAGAYPGIGAEERGQGEAIARSIERCLTLGQPMVATITGEGGSGGALAIAAANKVLMLEHATSIRWPSPTKTRHTSIVFRDNDRAPPPSRPEGDEDHRPGPDRLFHHRRDHRGAGRLALRRRPAKPSSPRSATPSRPSCKAWPASPRRPARTARRPLLLRHRPRQDGLKRTHQDFSLWEKSWAAASRYCSAFSAAPSSSTLSGVVLQLHMKRTLPSRKR